MRLALVIVAICLACAPAIVDPAEETEENATGCGVERWAIKTGVDGDSITVVQKPVAGTSAALVALPQQAGTDTSRIAPTEYITYQLADVTLVQYRKESDGDYHLVLSDGAHTLIAEIPDPACVTAGPFLTSITTARAAFDAKHPNAGSVVVVNETVTVAGVGFYDFLHSQTGVAPNAIELHPVLSICFGAKCAAPITPSGGPSPTHGCSSAPAAWLALLPLLLRRRNR